MNGHLSSDQISRWLIGERTAAEEQHARECPECRAELARLESAIALFRSSARDWSEQWGTSFQAAAGLSPGVGAPRNTWRWAWIAAAALLLAAIPLYTRARDRQRRAERARADAALIEQVDAGVSRAVPASMEPLVQLVQWGPGLAGEENQPGNRINKGEYR